MRSFFCQNYKKEKGMIERRSFLQTLAAAMPAMMLPWQACDGNAQDGNASDRLGELLPQRQLGRTNIPVTMLGVGGFHVGWTTEKDAQAVIETALEGGVRFFDTAESYARGVSEERYGKYITPKYRDQVFIMTKSTARDAETAQRHLDESLQRLDTDYIDLWQVHSLQNPEDVDNRINNGVLDVFIQAKQSGKVKYIGFTGHKNPYAHLRMLEQTESSDLFDTCQMPISVVDAASEHSFTRLVLPKLQERSIAPLAMKTLADGRFFAKKVRLEDIQWESENPVVPDHVTLEQAIHFAWSMPISVLITGAENSDLMQEKIEMAKSFAALNEEKRQALVTKVEDLAREGKVEYYKDV
ncbi:aldo/keto reductase [candidate division KSB1 bacterium]|nr:aldo/keto reductase [candidate division KSB1 bacterium]